MSQIGEHLWEGRYSPKRPDGKIHARNVYANTESECEEKLAELIRQMKAEIVETTKASTGDEKNGSRVRTGKDLPRCNQ